MSVPGSSDDSFAPLKKWQLNIKYNGLPPRHCNLRKAVFFPKWKLSFGMIYVFCLSTRFSDPEKTKEEGRENHRQVTTSEGINTGIRLTPDAARR